jgi:hypothetical protein
VESLLLHWRNLVAQRDDCARRIENGTATKATRRRLPQLNKEIRATWAEVRATCETMKPDKIAKLFAVSRPVYGWQEAATAIIELYVLLDRSANADKTVSLAEKRVELSTKELLRLLEDNGHSIWKDDDLAQHYLRRFVRDNLCVTLRSERGKRSSDNKRVFRGLR